MTRTVDLTHPIEPGMPVYPGDPEVGFTRCATRAADGFDVTALTLGSQSGTHLDAPSHRVDGASVEAVSVRRCVGPATVVDVTGRAPGSVLGPTDVAEAAAGIVLLHTGWATRFGDPSYFRAPVLSESAARRLVAIGTTLVGIDAPSVDPVDAGGHPAHDVLLGAGIPIVENLCALDEIDFPEPWFVALPLPLRGVDGSPVRAVAFGFG